MDVDDDSDASEQVKQWNGGRRVTPTVLLPEGNVVAGNNRLTAPISEELEDSLRDHGIR